MKKKLFYGAILSLMLFACKKDVEMTSFLEISQEQVDYLEQPFVQEASDKMILVKSGFTVLKASSSEKWCKVAIVEEDDATYLRVETLPNTGFSTREADVLLYGTNIPNKEFTVTQLGSEPTIAVKTEPIELIDDEITFSLLITSNVDFEIVLPDWIDDAADNTPFIGAETYSFTAESRILPGEREGEIQVKAKKEEYEGLNVSIPITQFQNVLNPIINSISPLSGTKGTKATIEGQDFGLSPELAQIFFDDQEAEIVSFADDKIEVIVPRKINEKPVITVDVAGVAGTFEDSFTYSKSWALHTLTGNGDANFKEGTLDEAQFRARYIIADDNDNIIASQTDNTNGRHVIKVNIADNSVVSLASQDANGIVPDSPELGPNGVFYVSNDSKNGTSYYKFDPQNNWLPEEQTITYAGTKPPSGSYMYKLTYNKHDGHLYGFLGSAEALIVKVNPSTNQGEILYTHDQNTWWYGSAVHPTADNLIYTVINNNTQQGLYQLDLDNPAAGLVRLNSNGPVTRANASQITEGPLTETGFGNAWGMTFGKDGKLYVADQGNHIIRRIDLDANTIETVVGVAGAAGNADGNKQNARLNGPRGITWNKDGTALYISDFGNSRVKEWAFD